MEDYTDYYRFNWLMKRPASRFPLLASIWIPVTLAGLYIIIFIIPRIKDPSPTIQTASHLINFIMGLLILSGLFFMVQSIRRGIGPSIISCSISKQGLLLGSQLTSLNELKNNPDNPLIKHLKFTTDHQRQSFERSLSHYLSN
jgi:hypothetical protein